MEEEDLRRLETKYRAKTGLSPKVTIPPGAASEDLGEFVRMASKVKMDLAAAKKKNDNRLVAQLQGHLESLKRVARARAIQRQLNKLEGKPAGYLQPWPSPPTRLGSPPK